MKVRDMDAPTLRALAVESDRWEARLLDRAARGHGYDAGLLLEAARWHAAAASRLQRRAAVAEKAQARAEECALRDGGGLNDAGQEPPGCARRGITDG